MFLLEIGLCIVILAAPLPFGAVGPAGRLTLEIAALVLTAGWTLIAARRRVAVPPPSARIALCALLLIAFLQALPLGHGVVSVLSPRAEALRNGLDPAPAATLSLAPEATASALRTGAALAGLLLVTTSVAAERGASRLALSALVSAAFQGLYGLLVLASGHARIWDVPKTAYLNDATGTFVNKNHFAGFLAATIPLGIGLVLAAGRRAREGSRRKGGLLLALGRPEGTRALLCALAVLIALGGLLLSFSRAGIALGLGAASATFVLAVRGKPVHRAMAITLVVAIAAVPLLDIGADRLMERYASSGSDLQLAGGRATVWLDTLRMIAAFPVGCGFGTFTWVFPVFSAPSVRLHYTHAHNDLLQLGAEGGLVALVLMCVLLAALGRAAWRALGARDPLVVGAAAGLAAILLHGLVDFDFHIPADAAIAAVLAGVLFGASWTARD